MSKISPFGFAPRPAREIGHWWGSGGLVLQVASPSASTIVDVSSPRGGSPSGASPSAGVSDSGYASPSRRVSRFSSRTATERHDRQAREGTSARCSCLSPCRSSGPSGLSAPVRRRLAPSRLAVSGLSLSRRGSRCVHVRPPRFQSNSTRGVCRYQISLRGGGGGIHYYSTAVRGQLSAREPQWRRE